MSIAFIPSKALVSPALSLTSCTFVPGTSDICDRSHAPVLAWENSDGRRVQPSAIFNWASKVSFRRNNDKTQTQPQPIDFRSMTKPVPISPPFFGTVISVNSLTTNDEYVELVVDVSQSGVHEDHKVPGQSIHIGRVTDNSPESVVAVISSPPQSGPLLHFLIATSCDPCKLANLETGDEVAVGNVWGEGIDYARAANEHRNLFLFVDSPQGFAAVRSLVEWPMFRTITGAGANRTTEITVYYSLPSASAIPYSHCFSKWSAYAVNVVPVVGKSIMEFMSMETSLGRNFDSAGSDYAISALRLEQSYEALFCSLVLLGFRRLAIGKFTEETVARGQNGTSTNNNMNESHYQTTFNNFDASYKTKVDPCTERTSTRKGSPVWDSWVRIREDMRVEFEDMWTEKSQNERDQQQTQKENQKAWERWAAQNQEQWSNFKWDDEVWQDYWRTWHTEDNGRGKRSNRGASYDWTASEPKWKQQDSQEYWDWVRRGTESTRSSTKSDSTWNPQDYWDWAGRGPQSTQSSNQSSSQTSSQTGQKSSSYWWSQASQQRSGPTSSWDHSDSSYSSGQQGGYRHDYDNAHRSGRSQSSGGYSAGSSSGWGSWRNSWSSWGGARGRNYYGSASSSSPKVDLYAVLGINSGASRSEIKKAYRQKAMEHHPDRNPERIEDAHVKMKQIVVAWTVLKNDYSRRKYDSYGVGDF